MNTLQLATLAALSALALLAPPAAAECDVQPVADPTSTVEVEVTYCYLHGEYVVAGGYEGHVGPKAFKGFYWLEL